MISYNDIRELRQYSSSADSRVLSVYLNVDQGKAANLNRGFETALESLLRQVADTQVRSKDGDLSNFESEKRRLMAFLREYTPKGKSLVVFSDSSRSFWWHREVQADVPTEARWSPQPWLRPLLALIEQHDALGVVLIDKHKARILLIDLSGVEELLVIDSDVPGRHQTTGTDHIWSQNHMERDHVKHIKWYARTVGDALSNVVDRLKLKRLAIGGPVEATSIFSDELPKRLSHMVLGTLSIPVDITTDRLLATLGDLQEQAETQDELRLVESLITAARKNDRAVLGLPETLTAVQEGRIHRLVVNSAFRCAGAECVQCRVLLPPGAASCRYCGGQAEPAPDLINRLSHRVLERDGRINTVSGAAAETLSAVGSIGAVLRF